MDDLAQINNDDSRVVITEENTTILLTVEDGQSTITLTIALFYCEEDSYCLIDDVIITVPLFITPTSSNNQIVVNREVTLPDFLTASN